jgi:Cu(I)/Ag(I) efflux system membrane fusion protein
VNQTLKLALVFFGGAGVALGGMLALQSRHAGPAVAQASASQAASAAMRAPVQVPSAQAERIGLDVAPATMTPVSESQRLVATVVPDETRISHIHTRVNGWLERLYVPVTGAAVKAGQPIVEIYSQELYSSQLDHLAARAFSGPPSALAESGRARLKFLGMNDGDIERLEATGKARRTVTLYAPRSGILAHRGAAPGAAVDPSTEIAVVLDLSRVWVIAELPASAAESVRKGQEARLQLGAVSRNAKVEFIEPMVTESRTVKVRFSLPNADGALRPGMYGSVDMAPSPRMALTVPREAVVDTGEFQYVYHRSADGEYMPHRVTVGRRDRDRIEILSGLQQGAMVVTSGVFLLDAESRLRASGGQAHAHGSHGAASTPAPAPAPAPGPAGTTGHKHD